MAQATIQFLGHSTTLITTEAGKKVLVDAFLSENPACPENLKDPGKIDLIILTHGHADHTGDIITLAKKYSPKICAAYELQSLLVQDGIPETLMERMNKGGSVKIGDLKISLTQAFHSSSYDALDGKTYYAGEPCGVVVTLESGRTIYHAGDTGLFSDMRLIGERYQPEVALLPIGDRFTMDPHDAAIATSLIKPKTIIPIHHSTFDILTGTTEDFKNELGNAESKLRILAPGEIFKF
ncbi:metal-dependent hydrolase [bacterium]|nr:metal-dependent hydrolase [bacterium]